MLDLTSITRQNAKRLDAKLLNINNGTLGSQKYTETFLHTISYSAYSSRMQMTKPKLESTLVGVAGEYATAAELTLRNYIAAISLRNSRGTDIIATSTDGSRSFSIQVKTTNEGKPHWMLNEKSEHSTAGSHFYVFVKLNGSKNRPDFYVVPSAVVADRISTSHKAWLAEPKRDGTSRKDTSMRKFTDEQGEFLECWNVLETASSGKAAE